MYDSDRTRGRESGQVGCSSQVLMKIVPMMSHLGRLTHDPFGPPPHA